MLHGQHDTSPELRVAAAVGILRNQGLRITAPRLAMLRILASEHGPFSSEELFRRLRGTRCDLVTVYRSLSAMEEAGVLRRCDFGDGIHRYEFDAGGAHHHHVICRICRKAEIIDMCVVEGIERMLRDRGYAKVTHVLDLFGICPECQRREATGPASARGTQRASAPGGARLKRRRPPHRRSR